MWYPLLFMLLMATPSTDSSSGMPSPLSTGSDSSALCSSELPEKVSCMTKLLSTLEDLECLESNHIWFSSSLEFRTFRI